MQQELLLILTHPLALTTGPSCLTFTKQKPTPSPHSSCQCISQHFWEFPRALWCFEAIPRSCWVTHQRNVKAAQVLPS